jgi:hypothetical protein
MAGTCHGERAAASQPTGTPATTEILGAGSTTLGDMRRGGEAPGGGGEGDAQAERAENADSPAKEQDLPAPRRGQKTPRCHGRRCEWHEVLRETSDVMGASVSRGL